MAECPLHRHPTYDRSLRAVGVIPTSLERDQASIYLKTHLRSRAQSSSFVYQIIFLRLVCVGVSVGCNVWLFFTFLCGPISPDFPARDLHGTFNCKLPQQYQWTEKIGVDGQKCVTQCDTNDVNVQCDVNTPCKGSVTSLSHFSPVEKSEELLLSCSFNRKGLDMCVVIFEIATK